MRLSKIILSSSVGVGGGVQIGVTVTDEAEDDSIEVVVVVSAVVSGIVVVCVRVIGLRGTALPSMASVLLVSGTGLALSWWSFEGGAREWSIFLRLLLLSWTHRGECRER